MSDCPFVASSTRSTQRAQTSLAKADHYSHIAHCKNVEPWWWKTTPPPPPQIIIKKRSFGSLPAPRSGYATLLSFFSHLLILEYPNHHQNLISSSRDYPGRHPKISSQSVHNFLSNVVHKQTNKQTNQRHQKHNLLCQGGNEGASISRPLVVHLVFGGIFFSNQTTKFWMMTILKILPQHILSKLAMQVIIQNLWGLVFTT